MWFKRASIEDVKLDLPLAVLKRLSRIVLIEDQPETFPLALLRGEGYSIEHWSQVQDLRTLEERQFDVVILDIHGVAGKWSDLDGLGVLEHLKNKVPGLAVIAFSGQTYDLGRHKFFQLADDVLSKPVDAVKCKQVIDGVLKTHFTPVHLWNTVQPMLRSQGVGDREIAKLEARIAKTMTNNPARLADVVEKYGPYVKASVTTATLINKLIQLIQAAH